MSFIKTEGQQGKTGPVWGVGTSEMGKDIRKGWRNGGRGDKGEWWQGWIYLRYIVSTFVNVTMYTQYNNMIIKINKNTNRKRYNTQHMIKYFFNKVIKYICISSIKYQAKYLYKCCRVYFKYALFCMKRPLNKDNYGILWCLGMNFCCRETIVDKKTPVIFRTANNLCCCNIVL
jgi:hypothetical protein